MTKPIAEATIVGDFRDGHEVRRSRSRVHVRHEGRQAVSCRCRSAARAPETFTVDYTLGAKRYQGYLSTLPDGRIYVLPVFWHIASKRWVDWKEITPIPDGAHDIRQIWNANCFNCHATNIVQGFDVAEKKYQSTWTEMGIGCEACHGPGREHVALMEAWEKDPGVEAGLRQQLEEPAAERHPEDLLAAQRRSRGASTTRAPTATATSATCSSASRAAIATRTTRCRS